MPLLGLKNFTDAVVDAGRSGLSDLEVVEAEIEEVIRTITRQIARIEPDRFDSKGHISARSFGGGERVDWLSFNYSGAHQATVQTLRNTRSRLLEFQVACKEARQLIDEIDQDSATTFKRQSVALQALTQGAGGYWGGDR